MTITATANYSPVYTFLEYRTQVYEASAVAQSEAIQMIPVKKGEVVVDVILDADALGASTSVSVGDGADPDRFITNTTTTSATVTRLNSAADVGRGYVYPADDTIDVTVVGGGAVSNTIRLTAVICRTY